MPERERSRRRCGLVDAPPVQEEEANGEAFLFGKLGNEAKEFLGVVESFGINSGSSRRLFG